MHQYLKAIGFSNITTRRQERELLEETEEDFSSHTLAELTKDCDFCEFVREYGIGIGVKSCGEINAGMNLNENIIFRILKEVELPPTPM